MRARVVLAAVILAVGLCLVPGMEHGKIRHWMDETKASYMDVTLLQAVVIYMMNNPTSFLNVFFFYDPAIKPPRSALPTDIHLESKIYVMITDNRGLFARFSGIALRDVFKKQLTVICTYIGHVITDMDIDVVAEFRSEADNPVGYFYRGEYHLWGE